MWNEEWSKEEKKWKATIIITGWIYQYHESYEYCLRMKIEMLKSSNSHKNISTSASTLPLFYDEVANNNTYVYTSKAELMANVKIEKKSQVKPNCDIQLWFRLWITFFRRNEEEEEKKVLALWLFHWLPLTSCEFWYIRHFKMKIFFSEEGNFTVLQFFFLCLTTTTCKIETAWTLIYDRDDVWKTSHIIVSMED